MFDPTAATWPENDEMFRDETLTEVKPSGEGYEITDSEGWTLFVRSPELKPAVGMKARFYGRGIGYPVRGLFLDGHAIFYETEDQQEQRLIVERYGASAQELLDRWDAGKIVWTIVMGGISPGYEQALQITAFEMIRALLKQDPIDWEALQDDREATRALYDKISAEVTPIVDAKLGLSGAQFGAAWNMATVFVRHGPVKAMSMVEKDRHQQQSRRYPTLDEVFTQREAAVIAQIFPMFDTAEDLLFSLHGELRHSFTMKEAEALLSRMNDLRPDA